MQNILKFTADWKPTPKAMVSYVGSESGKAHLIASGFDIKALSTRPNKKGDVLIIGSDSSTPLDSAQVTTWSNAGGKVLFVGLNQKEIENLFKGQFKVGTGEHIATYFESGTTDNWLKGLCSADVHNRTASKIGLLSSASGTIGDGVLANFSDTYIFCQLAPWQFDSTKIGEKRTFRRTAYLLSRLAANLGIATKSPILDNLSRSTESGKERRWLNGLYLDIPEEWDDPYRFFPW